MPEGLGEARQSNHDTPQQEGDTQPQGPTTIVGQEPCEEPSQRVEVVEHRTSHYLVGEARAAVAVLTHLRGEVGVIVVEYWCGVATVAGVGPAKSDSRLRFVIGCT